jgi:uncharacterized membrane protein YgcG
MRSPMNKAGRAVLLLLASAALAAASPTSMPSPGAVNYVEGQVTLDGRNLSPASVGSALLETSQVLTTGQGRAELLLTPGIFLRTGDNSEVRMVSPGLADTQVELVHGSALLEVTELFKENNLSVLVNGVAARIDKKGLYDFNADQPAISVLDGEATVSQGDMHVTLKKGHTVLLASGQPLKAQSFKKDAVESDRLYRWSKLRSEYEAQANVETAQTIVVNGGWYGPGWYWDPFWSFYAFLPGDGILYSPFGWGFYSPGWVWRAPHRIYHPYPVVGGVPRSTKPVAAGSANATRASSGGSAHGSGGGGFAAHGGGGGGFGGGHGGGGGGGGHR